ncbi:MAG TPA: hypothetical protein VGM01_12050 [Ktedonobacteraceae bacterium]|jgi:hypothetical protein
MPASRDDSALTEIVENGYEHHFGIDILVEAEATRFRAIGEHIIAPGGYEIAEALG